MRILLLTIGTRGDVQPFIALGAALKARGHCITVTTGQGFDTMIEQQGLKSTPVSVDMRELLHKPEIRRAMHSLSGKIEALRTSKSMMRQQLDEMWAIAQSVRPDLIVYHPKAFAAPQFAAALGAIAMPAFLQPAYVATGDFPNPLFGAANLGRLGNRLSHELLRPLMRLGLSGLLKDLCQQSPALERLKGLNVLDGYRKSNGPVVRLHAFSPLLVPRPQDWSERERITGYWFTDSSPQCKPPDTLLRFLDAGLPPVYVGFGSMPADDARRITRIVLEALERSDERGILATGWGALDNVAPSERIHVLDNAPHRWLFPRCATIVHHGGAGTTHESLRSGRPSIVCPVFGDQPFWGRRVFDLNAGPAPLAKNKLTAATLTDALIYARSLTVVSHAAEIGTALRREDGANDAATAIEAELGRCD